MSPDVWKHVRQIVSAAHEKQEKCKRLSPHSKMVLGWNSWTLGSIPHDLMQEKQVWRMDDACILFQGLHITWWLQVNWSPNGKKKEDMSYSFCMFLYIWFSLYTRSWKIQFRFEYLLMSFLPFCTVAAPVMSSYVVQMNHCTVAAARNEKRHHSLTRCILKDLNLNFCNFCSMQTPCDVTPSNEVK